MLHSKVTVIDGRWTVVGSCNLDSRGLWWNLEFFCVVQSPALAAAIEQICAFEMAHSRQVRLGEYQRRSWWQCLRDRGAFALRGLL